MVTCSDSLRSLQASFKRSIAFGSSAGFVLRAAGLLRVEASGNHAALKHFVGNRSGHLIDEFRAHLRITPQVLQGFLLLW